MVNIFFDIGLMIIFATVLGFLARVLKQPLIPIYILAGLIIGPVGFGFITDLETIKTLAEIGVAFLLFMVGLELDFRKLKDVGLLSSVGGSVQIISLFLLGMLIASWLGFVGEQVIYLGLIVAFSSTMVVVKLLSDKEELDTLHGRIIIGFLLMEDLFAIIALSTLQTIDNMSFLVLFIAIFKGFAMLVIAYLASRFIFPKIFKIAAKTPEILFLMAITVCFSFGIISTFFGFSIAIGAFIGGVALANLPYNIEIESRVKSLRDFFSTIFFVSLGMELVLDKFATWIPIIVALTFLVIIVKPILTTLICSFFGYKRKASFMTSISLAQTSEFSLIIVAQGALLGHLSQDFLSLTTILAVITVTISTYFIKFDKQLYNKLSKYLKIFENLSPVNKELHFIKEDHTHNAILIGYDRMGYSIAKSLERMKKDYVIVDLNPDIIRSLIKKKIPCIYGDFSDIEILEKLKLRNIDMVISTIPDVKSNHLLIKKIKEVNVHATIIVTALTVNDSLELYDLGADYVIVPHLLGGNHVAILLEDVSGSIDKMIETKINHIKELKHRKYIHHHK